MTLQIDRENDLLLLIDPQRDFCAGGNLAVADGDAVIPLINQLAGHFRHIIVTQDWHPAGHSSFASSHPGAEPYQSIQASYGPQTLWPDHCIQGSLGAEFHPDLDLQVLHRAELILRKGFRPEIDSYSAFFENDHQTPTGLAGYLRERGIAQTAQDTAGRIFVAGLAYDFCVRYSAVDAVRAGFHAFVIEDACRAVGLPGSVEATRREFAGFNIPAVPSSHILS